MSPRYGLTFLLLSLTAALAARAPAAPGVRVAGGSAALAFALVAGAYIGAGPGLLLKRPDGRRGLAAWAVLWPYLLLNEVALLLARRVGREAPFIRVAPNLDLGRRLTAREARRLDPGWVAVLDLAAELAEAALLRAVPAYGSFPVLDATAPPPAQLAAAVAWLREQTRRGPVYLHCALGHGRSATVAAAYLLATGAAPTPEAALASLQAVRPGVALNPAQRGALHRYAATLTAPP